MLKQFKEGLFISRNVKRAGKTNSLSLSLVALSVAALCFSQVSPAFAKNSATQAEQTKFTEQPTQVSAFAQTQDQISAPYGDFAVTGDTSTVSFADSVLTISGGEHTIAMAEGATLPTAQRIEVTGASTLTLSGVSIETASGPALKIADNASFDVNIILASNNVLKATTDGYAGLQKNGTNGVGTLTISGTGSLDVSGGLEGAGIGPSKNEATSRITINGGRISATCPVQVSKFASGIGGYGSSYITINGGYVYAKASCSTAIMGSHIALNGGIIEAVGLYACPAIGSLQSNDNVMNGNVTVIASSDQTGTQLLAGFDTTTGLVKGILIANADPDRGEPWTSSIYGNTTTITTDPEATNQTPNIPIEFPGSLTIPSGKTVTIGSDVALTMASGKSITVEDGASLINASTALAEDFPVTLNGTGTLSSEMNFYRYGATSPYLTNYQVYKTASGVQNYTNLPNPDASNAFLNWYYLNDADQKVAIYDGDPVLLNEHNFYELSEYTIATQAQGNGTVQCSDKGIGGETVTFMLLPDAGYKVEDGSVAVMAEATPVSIADEGNLTYSFIMPASNVVISAAFVADDVTPASDDASLLPLTGDLHHSLVSALLSVAGVGIALLGVAGILKTRRD